jgi:hypothetical protein
MMLDNRCSRCKARIKGCAVVGLINRLVVCMGRGQPVMMLRGLVVRLLVARLMGLWIRLMMGPMSMV